MSDNMQQWIPVTERLPEWNTLVLVIDRETDPDLPHAIAQLTLDGWRFEGFGISRGITHWMPLPAPPEIEAQT